MSRVQVLVGFQRAADRDAEGRYPISASHWLADGHNKRKPHISNYLLHFRSLGLSGPYGRVQRVWCRQMSARVNARSPPELAPSRERTGSTPDPKAQPAPTRVSNTPRWPDRALARRCLGVGSTGVCPRHRASHTCTTFRNSGYRRWSREIHALRADAGCGGWSRAEHSPSPSAGGVHRCRPSRQDALRRRERSKFTRPRASSVFQPGRGLGCGASGFEAAILSRR